MSIFTRKRKEEKVVSNKAPQNPFPIKGFINYLTLIDEDKSQMTSIHSGEDGSFIYVNHGCEYLLGYQPEELLGTSPYALYHPDDLAKIKVNHAYLMYNEEPTNVSYRLRHKDGHYVDVESFAWNTDEGIISLTRACEE